uniref:Uncharacterized protein n=1 Tax=Anguilla anguilla TaxID=7936 RepID=A0A0E9SNH2_ANGAN
MESKLLVCTLANVRFDNGRGNNVLFASHALPQCGKHLSKTADICIDLP